MTYRIEIAETAKADIREKVRWFRDEISPSAADRWLTGLEKSIAMLTTRPFRCPLAAESDNFPRPIRELYYGRSRTRRYRIIFEIRDDVVFIIAIRHSAQDAIEP